MAKEFVVNKLINQKIVEMDKKPSAVADRAGIRRDTFSKIIHCKRPVYADEVILIANAMGVKIDSLFPQNESA